MNNRFCRLGKSLLGVACLLSAYGVTYSCSDEIDLSDSKPSFLGASIYDELKNRTDRSFSTVIRLIDDLDYASILSQTGSKTLFVADDDAYKKFFEETTWTDGNGNPVRGYDQLSTAQKRLLLTSSMLNNAFVTEMLTTLPDATSPTKNVVLRRLTETTATDSLPYFKWDELPDNQNEGEISEDGTVSNKDTRFWEDLRQQSVGGIYMALDKTEPLMTHFLESQLKEKSITPSDISFILNLDGTSDAWTGTSYNRSYVYDARIVDRDVTCLNGYYNVLDKVLVTPPNMAELIRTNGDTKYFSQMLDRFSAPFYDASLTESYKVLHPNVNAVYQKLYLAQRGQKGAITEVQYGSKSSDKTSLSTYYINNRLPFDPGWNSYTVNNSTKEQDMAAMFVPSDEAIEKYFLEGGGRSMLDTYAPDKTKSLEYRLYQIPLDILYALVNNLMKESFIETVPSKYQTIMNDAKDQMFATTSTQNQTVDEYKKNFKKVLLANNGVIYVLNGMVTPAMYASVMAPVLYSKNAKVMNAVLQADKGYVDNDYNNAPFNKFYSTYLLAMQSDFSLFVPTDSGLLQHGYLDPLSYVSNSALARRFWTFEYSDEKATGKVVPVIAKAYRYRENEDLNPSGNPSATSLATDNLSSSSTGQTKKQMLVDMVDQHILVHTTEEANAGGVTNDKHFYIARSGAPIYVKERGNDANGVGMVVDGGFQLLVNNDNNPNNDFDCVVLSGEDKTRTGAGNGGYGNGHTYFLDRPMQPTYKNVYNILEDNSDFSEFLALCKTLDGSGEDMFKKIYATEEKVTKDGDETKYTIEQVFTDTKWDTEKQKYNIFSTNQTEGSKMSGTRYTAMGTNLIRFFNNYRYTIFVPTNEQMEEAYNQGLPTLEEIESYVNSNLKITTAKATLTEEEYNAQTEARAKAKAMVECLVNFVRYHFCDESYFVDKYNDSPTSVQSACSLNGNYVTFELQHINGAIKLTDAAGQSITTTSTNNKLARDYELNTGANSSPSSIANSSYVSIHGIDHFMLFDASLKGDFTKAWQTEATARAFAKKYKLRN